MGGGYLHELHASLDQRWRPEDVLRTILAGDPDALPETLTRRVTLRGGPPPTRAVLRLRGTMTAWPANPARTSTLPAAGNRWPPSTPTSPVSAS
jgi:hypothetical protein